jgi:hypothetical protein
MARGCARSRRLAGDLSGKVLRERRPEAGGRSKCRVRAFYILVADPARGVRPPWARPGPVVAASVPLAHVVAMSASIAGVRPIRQISRRLSAPLRAQTLRCPETRSRDPGQLLSLEIWQRGTAVKPSAQPRLSLRWFEPNTCHNTCHTSENRPLTSTYIVRGLSCSMRLCAALGGRVRVAVPNTCASPWRRAHGSGSHVIATYVRPARGVLSFAALRSRHVAGVEKLRWLSSNRALCA